MRTGNPRRALALVASLAIGLGMAPGALSQTAPPPAAPGARGAGRGGGACGGEDLAQWRRPKSVRARIKNQ